MLCWAKLVILVNLIKHFECKMDNDFLMQRCTTCTLMSLRYKALLYYCCYMFIFYNFSYILYNSLSIKLIKYISFQKYKYILEKEGSQIHEYNTERWAPWM